MFDVVVEIVCLFEHVLMVTLHRVVCPVIWTSRFRREVFFTASRHFRKLIIDSFTRSAFSSFFFTRSAFFWRKTRSALIIDFFTRSAFSSFFLPDLPFFLEKN